MAWRKRPQEFPLWGKVVAWALILSFVAWMAVYAANHAPNLVIQVVEMTNSIFD